MMKPGWIKRKIIYNDLKNIIKKEVQVNKWNFLGVLQLRKKLKVATSKLCIIHRSITLLMSSVLVYWMCWIQTWKIQTFLEDQMSNRTGGRIRKAYWVLKMLRPSLELSKTAVILEDAELETWIDATYGTVWICLSLRITSFASKSIYS